MRNARVGLLGLQTFNSENKRFVNETCLQKSRPALNNSINNLSNNEIPICVIFNNHFVALNIGMENHT